VTRAQSQVCTLKRLEVTVAYAALSPRFDPSVFQYTTVVNYDVNSIHFKLQYTHRHSIAEFNGVQVTSDESQDIPLAPNANTTIEVKVYAQDRSYLNTYYIRAFRSRAPVTNTQVIRGSLRDARCLQQVPNICHLPEYYMTAVPVNATNPSDFGLASNVSFSNSFGTFEVRFPFSDASIGKTGYIHVNWLAPSLRANLHTGGVRLPFTIGSATSVGQGFAHDLNQDVGFLYWWPPEWADDKESISGVVKNAMDNKPLGYEVNSMFDFSSSYGYGSGYGTGYGTSPAAPAPTPLPAPLATEATVSLYDQQTDILLKTTTADKQTGEYRFDDLSPGQYTVRASASGFLTANSSHASWNDKGVNLALSPVVHGDELRVVLTWETYPNPGTKDMDLHMLFRPQPKDNCDVHFAWMKCGWSALDVDNVAGGQNGAETITIHKPVSTVYTIFLDNFNGDLNAWRGRNNWDATTPLEDERNQAHWLGIDPAEFDFVPASGWATELSGSTVRVLSKTGELVSIRVPSHPEDPDSAHYYRDKPATAFDGGYRPESRYIRLLCMDFTGPSPKIYKVPQFSSTPPTAMDSCTGDSLSPSRRNDRWNQLY